MNRDKIRICSANVLACVSVPVSVSNAKMYKFVSLASLFVRYEWQWQWGNSVLSNWMHRRTHARPNYSMVDVDVFPLLATHCVCIEQTGIRTIGDFRVGKPTHIHKSHARFSVSQKSTQYISECRKSETLWKSKLIHVMACKCACVYSFIFLLKFCCFYFVACELTLRSHFGNAT